MKYIIDIPEEYTKHGFVVKVEAIPDLKGYRGTHLIAESYTEPDGCDGCDGCKYTDTEEWEEPCRRCKNSYKLMWRAKG